MSSAAGAPGAAVPITVSLSGDGETTLAGISIVFDGAKLLLPVESGPIPGDSANGAFCQRVSLNRINVLLYSLDQTPIAAGPLSLCKLPFTLAKPLSRGSTAITAQNPECFNETSPSARCTAESGTVQILGAVTPAPPQSTVSERQIHLLLSADPRAPSVAQIASFDFASDRPRPLAGLAIEAPFAADALIIPRAESDFLTYLKTYPNTARAKLERYAVIRYRPNANLDLALAVLRRERFVSMAYAVQLAPASEPKPKQQPPAPAPIPQLGPVAKSVSNQYHLDALNIPGLWLRAGGWSLVGILDSGLEVAHSNLHSFSGAGSLNGTYTKGNFLPVYSRDLRYNVDNVDERRAVPVQTSGNSDLTALYQQCDLLDGEDDNLMVPTAVGHGTHVSGLIASRSTASNDMLGVCKNCGLGMGKITQYACIAVTPRIISPEPVPPSIVTGLNYFSGTGAQVINASFGINGIFAYPGNCQTPSPDQFTPPNSNTAVCLAITFAHENDVVIVGASGNNRDLVQFPAEDPRVVAVGGLGANLGLWDESLGSTDNCPLSPSESECGSNYTVIPGTRKQELMAPAQSVRSTIYTGFNYNPFLGCGDSFGDANGNNGAGNCTGTSMSSPEIAGIFGVLRSINPLLATGDPESSIFGLRDLLVNSTQEAQQGIGWQPTLGYGRPDPRGAADAILGTVRGEILRNRPIPLFGLYSPGATDYAAVATPQNAMVLARYSAAAYQSVPIPGNSFIGGSTIARYGAFPHEAGTPSPTPIAIAYVLSTEFPTQLEPNRPVISLYLLDRARSWPLNCAPPNCNQANRDFILLSSTARVESAVAAGYRFRGLQGYVFGTQAVGSLPLHLKCKLSEDDCAVFLEDKRAQFEAAGYTVLFPGSGSSILGYAFTTADFDGDGLADGVEYVIGTNPNLPNSDGDDLDDGDEFFINAVSYDDPCSGPVTNCLGVVEAIFANGFE